MFGIKKVRSTHVANNEVVDDGFNVKDIEANLTVEALQTFLKNPGTDLDQLFTLLVDTLEGRTPEVTIMPDIIAVPNDDLLNTGFGIEPISDLDPIEMGVIKESKPKKNAKTKKSQQK